MDANIQSEHRLWIEYFHDDRNADRSSRSEYNAVNASLSSVPCDGRDWEPIYTDFSFQMRQTFLQVLRVLLLAVVLIPLYIRNCDTKHLWWKIFLDDLCTFISWTTCLLSFYNFCIASSILQTVNSQNGYLPVVTYAPEKIQCLYVWESIDLAVLDARNLFLTIDIEPILMYIEGVPNTVTLNTTWRWQAYCAPMTYCWGVDEPSHDAQEFMGHVSDWMIERVSFRSVPVLCMNKRFLFQRNAWVYKVCGCNA